MLINIGLFFENYINRSSYETRQPNDFNRYDIGPKRMGQLEMHQLIKICYGPHMDISQENVELLEVHLVIGLHITEPIFFSSQTCLSLLIYSLQLIINYRLQIKQAIAKQKERVGWGERKSCGYTKQIGMARFCGKNESLRYVYYIYKAEVMIQNLEPILNINGRSMMMLGIIIYQLIGILFSFT